MGMSHDLTLLSLFSGHLERQLGQLSGQLRNAQNPYKNKAVASLPAWDRKPWREEAEGSAVIPTFHPSISHNFPLFPVFPRFFPPKGIFGLSKSEQI